ncbi:MAG: PmoA family protein [Gemmataceae bacterium]
MMRRLSGWLALGLFATCAAAAEPELSIKSDQERIAIHRAGLAEPLVVQMAKADFRPYLHPLLAPDGKGVLTEYSPGHHKHQTGLYIGHTRINGRDYFHHPGDGYFVRKKMDAGKADGPRARWSVVYDLMSADKKPVLSETQQWQLTDHGDYYVLDLDWKGDAQTEVTVGKYDYGGLFLRMPWRGTSGGKAVNSDGKVNGQCEGQPARWVDVGMPIEGRPKEDWAHIALLDHPDNAGHPQKWRVDGQLGVGPCRARSGDWKIEPGKPAAARYRFVVYTGALDTKKIESAWQEFVGK